MNRERIKELENQIAELHSRWPTHSVSPGMLQELEELEAQLERELKKASVTPDDAKGGGGCDPPQARTT